MFEIQCILYTQTLRNHSFNFPQPSTLHFTNPSPKPLRP